MRLTCKNCGDTADYFLGEVELKLLMYVTLDRHGEESVQASDIRLEGNISSSLVVRCPYCDNTGKLKDITTVDRYCENRCRTKLIDEHLHTFCARLCKSFCPECFIKVKRNYCGDCAIKATCGLYTKNTKGE